MYYLIEDKYDIFLYQQLQFDSGIRDIFFSQESSPVEISYLL